MTDEGPLGWGAPLHRTVLEAAGVLAGTTLLDLGCGPGVFAAAAVAGGAVVTGLDTDPGAVAAASALVPAGRFSVGSADRPPPGPFDVVAAVQLLAHVPDPLAVLVAAAGVGALVVVTVWGREHECDVRAFGEALAPWLRPRPPSAGPTLSDPDTLRTVVTGAGLRVASVREVVCPFHYPDADAVLGPLFATGMGRHAVNRAGPVAVRGAVLDRLAAHRTPGGGYRLDNLFRVLTARPVTPGR